MADLNRINIADVDISKALRRDNGGVLLATGDELANRFGANVFRNGEPVDMTGCTVRGYFIRANDDTVVIDGVATGNTVYVDLPAACYSEPGIYSLAIKASGNGWVAGDPKSTIRLVHGYVKVTSTDNIADPDGVFSIMEILEAAARAEEAAERAEEAARNADNGGGGTGGGEPGADGFSPVANVKQTASGAVITITDKQGTTTATVSNGKDGVTPVKGVDYYTDTEKTEFQTYITQELAKREQVELLFADSVDGCTDTNKLYVLPDGYIYAYMASTGPSYTNLSETVHENKRMGSSGALSDLTGAVTTDFIPIRKGQTLRFKGFDPLTLPSGKYPYICFYTGASESKAVSSGVWDRLDWLKDSGQIEQESDDVWSYTAFVSPQNNSTPPHEHPLSSSITYIRLCGTMLSGQTVIVTVDEEIAEGGAGGYAWQNTGHAFAPADYEGRIVALERHVDAVPESRIKAIETALNTPSEAEYNGNVLYGKKWVACGDSFTAGGYDASDGFDKSVYIYQDGRFAGQQKVYPFMIGLRNDMNIVNLATGGQTMGQSSNSFMSRYQTIPADADYITIMLGINDKIQSIPVGTLEDTTTNSFCGCYNVAMEHILTNHPYAHIGIMVSHGTNAEIMTATRGIAERWGVPYLDYGSPKVPLMNRYTGRNVCAKAQEIRERNFCVASDGTTPTNAHPNTAAHEFESTFIEAWLRTL